MSSAPAGVRDLPGFWPGVHVRLAPLSGEPSAAPERRRRQSETVRGIALDLLREQGRPTEAIPRGSEGQPLWPPGWTGSLAHTDRCVVAALASRDVARSLGVDVEPDAPLPRDAEPLILRPEERPGGREVFCAKECVHKALHPETGTWLEFEEVRIVFDVERTAFRPEPVSARATAAFDGYRAEGRIVRIDGFVVAVLRLT